jgi:hypothetical protein
MLVGKYPFDGEDYMEILMHQLQDQPVPASMLVPELPTAIDDTISWLMAKDPADRPPSLRDAIGSFERAAEAAGISTTVPATWDTGPVKRVTTAPPRIARPVAETAIDPAPRRRAGLFVGLALAIVAGGIGIVIATRAPAEKPPVAEPLHPANTTAGTASTSLVVVPVDAPEESRSRSPWEDRRRTPRCSSPAS